MILLILRLLKGTVRICLKGGFPERFFNLCAHRGIDIWGLRRKGETYFGTVSAADYRRLRDVARKTGVKMRLEHKSGLPFIFHRYRNRFGIPLGAVIFTVTLIFLSKFIWNIQVTGTENISSKEIFSQLEELGLREGVKTENLDSGRLRTELLLKNKKLSWAAVNIEGAFAVVEVREIEETPPIDPNTPSDIKAKIDGRIVKLEVYSGTPVVSLGDAVVGGDLLVTGNVEYATGEQEHKHASARIIAETSREITVEIPLEQKITVRTGEIKLRRAISIFGIKIPLYLGTVKGEYELETELSPFYIKKVKLPAALAEGKYYLTSKRTVTYTPEQALDLARARLEIREKSELDQIEIKTKAEFVENSEKRVKLTMKYSCEENISVEESVLIN